MPNSENNHFESMFSILDLEKWPKVHNCKCSATVHPLWKNCLSCGQILCEAHGPGPCCSYCGADLQDTEESMLSKRKAKRMESLHQQTIGHVQKTIVTIGKCIR